MKNKPRVRLENWCIITHGSCTIAKGIVFGDKRFSDGTQIYTSELIKFDEYKLEAHTMNTIYELGTYLDQN